MRLISTGDTWIFQDNLAPFLRFAADLTKYHFSPDEIQIIDSAVRETDQERNRWYDYELTGDSTVSLSFAIDPGSSVVFWRAKCPA